ncbi:fasciclin domain-containing protein [Salinimicrobium tongyeongense]|uniref:Fasciclin domain-containing protein n=1 Tax=Salinimicrobium tongyeongense TaxID=2809707 RepID=A0ABY6NR79_9FLAO|nr:fasciclin domain-containing protein [Salinimicrobium tongyeongense]UZH55427.1 fasciclin domain-containing protein [Salinimicrobium tongyeongense]
MKRILFLICLGFVFYSCEKDNYLVDGGLSDPNLGVTTLEFFESHQQLDTLALLIARAGLLEETNSASTFFAPNNLSIKNYVQEILTEMRRIDPQAEYTVNDIPKDTLKKYMGGYIIPQQIKREVLTEQGEIYTAINGEERKISLEPVQDFNGPLETPPEYVFFTYKGGDTWDPWNQLVDDTKIRVRTSDLVSTNGIIHVLQGGHVLFNYEEK